MKRRSKQLISCMLMVIIFLTMFHGNTVSVAAKAAKLSKKDFTYTVNKKKSSFISDGDTDDWAYRWFSGKSSIKTYRGIKLKSTASAVKKKYGKTTKKKVKASESFSRYLEFASPWLDTSTWKSYLEYKYKKGANYKIRFYLNKSDKVSAIVYMRNIEKLKVSKNDLNIKMKYKTPDGSKVKTKTIAGKKVSMISKGTKFCLDKGDLEINPTVYDYVIYQYDKNGNLIATTDLEGASFDEDVDMDKLLEKRCYKWNYKKSEIVKSGTEFQCVDLDNLGEYNYFVLVISRVYGDKDLGVIQDFSPELYYFKYK